MKATMRMHGEPLFGGQMEFGVEAEIDNARMLTNRHLFTDMARVMRHMAEELHAESERVLLEDGGGEGLRLAQERETREDERGDNN